MRVLLLSRYSRLGASSRLRSYQYLPALSEAGIEVTAAPFFDDRYLTDLYSRRRPNVLRIARAYARRVLALRQRRRYDVLWIEYELLPWIPGIVERLLMPDIPSVVEYDDAIFHRYDRHRSAVVRVLLGQKIDSIMRRSTAVIAGNEYLAARARAAGASVVVTIPTVIDLTRYPAASSQRTGAFTIGWIGSPATAHYLDTVAPALRELSHAGTTRVRLVGAGHVSSLGDAADVRPWSEDREGDELAEFDVGIMPLPDTPWERGKCGYKLIQYMAAGKPVVASPVGVNRDLVQPGVTGLLATTPAEWVHALETLRADPELAARMGRAGRALVVREYSTAVTTPRLVSLFRSIQTRA